LALLKPKKYKSGKHPGRKRIDLVGKQFGRWTVVASAGTVGKKRSKESVFLCRCECGTERLVRGEGLRKGTSKSCGCANPGPENLRKVNAQRRNKPLVLRT
jgi:hypothetical protein